MIYEFTVPGDPRGKGRPRFFRAGAHVGIYPDDKTAAYENLVRMAFRNAFPGHELIMGATLELGLIVFIRIPKSASQRKRMMMLDGRIRPGKKPDCSNILKAVEDGLNGVAYVDDAQIVDVEIHKWYSTEPRVVVSIERVVGGEPSEIS